MSVTSIPGSPTKDWLADYALLASSIAQAYPNQRGVELVNALNRLCDIYFEISSQTLDHAGRGMESQPYLPK